MKRRKRRAPWLRLCRAAPSLSLLLCAAGLAFHTASAATFEARGAQFLAFTSFSSFNKSPGDGPGELRLTSVELVTRIDWNQLVASWNAEMPAAAYLRIEARAIYPERATKYYIMALWSGDPARHPRQSVPNQKDADGDVATDTLELQRPCRRFQIRLTLGGGAGHWPKLKFLGLSVRDTAAAPAALPPNRVAWGKVIPVPERSQMAYPDGKVSCSPATVSMLLAYWAQALHRPELDHDVPAVSEAVYDAKWPGTGNWPFNTAYAGSFHGMRAYVTRLSDISELEDWLAEGIPVGLSLCYDRLRSKGPGPNGHVVVCVGFTDAGDPIINDPGTRQNVRKIFPRKNLAYAWSYSRNTVYLIYPQDAEVPKDRFGHWHSWTSRLRGVP